MGRLPEAWLAPPAVRELRELVRHRAKLVAVRSGFKAGVHAVLAKQGVHTAVSDLFGLRGRAELDRASLDAAYRARVKMRPPRAGQAYPPISARTSSTGYPTAAGVGGSLAPADEIVVQARPNLPTGHDDGWRHIERYTDAWHGQIEIR